jgi:hypothetical protein
MEAVIFTLIGTRKEISVPEPAEFRPFDLRTLRHLYNSKDNSSSGRSDQEKSFVAQAS